MARHILSAAVHTDVEDRFHQLHSAMVLLGGITGGAVSLCLDERVTHLRWNSPKGKVNAGKQKMT